MGAAHERAFREIHLAEVPIGGVPVNMEGFAIFEPERGLAFRDRLCIWALPAFRVQCGGMSALLRGVPGLADMEAAIAHVTHNKALVR